MLTVQASKAEGLTELCLRDPAPHQVGMNAVNDGIYLECAIYLILKNQFKGKSYYTDLLDLFHEVPCVPSP